MEETLELTREQIAFIRTLNPLNQGIMYSAQSWHNLHENYKEHVREFENTNITRTQIFEEYTRFFNNPQNGNWIKPFILTMIWGFGNSGYKVYRTHLYLEQNNQNYISNALKLVNNNRFNDAFNELNNIRGLGMSFITKVLYFSSLRTGQNFPIILDLKVIKSLNDNFKIRLVYNRRRDYDRYIKLVHNTAHYHNLLPESIELYLFNL